MHQPVGGHRVVPCEGLVDACGCPVFAQRQIIGSMHKAQVRAVEWLARCHFAVWLGVDRRWLWVGRLEPEPARDFDGAQQDLQNMQRAAGLEAVGMGRNPAHGVEGHGPTRHCLVLFAAEVGPCVVKFKGFVKGDAGDFGGDRFDLAGFDTAAVSNHFGCILWIKVAFGHFMEDRMMRHTLGAVAAIKVRFDAFLVKRGQLAGFAVDDQFLAIFVTHQQTVFGGCFITVHQNRRIGVLCKVGQIDLARLHQLMNEGENEQTIGARRDPDPIIGNRVVARADRVDPNDPRTALFDFADPHFDRVAVVVFGDTEQHKQFGMVPIGLAKFPEGPAHSVDPSGGHVDRTEPAVSGVIRGAKALCKHGCERLRLVAACKEGQLFRMLVADGFQQAGRDLQGFVPRNSLKLTRPAGADTLHGVGQAGRGIDLHDACGSFGAEHPLVDRMIFVAFDIGNFAFLHMHIDPAAAGAHVAGRFAHLVRDVRACVKIRLRMGHWGLLLLCVRASGFGNL